MNICDDNRFEIIEKAKEALLDSTNIEQSPDEMKVLNDFLFRCWQMGWLDKYDVPDTNVGEWIPCSERLPEDTKTKAITFADSSVDAGYYSEEKWWCVGDSVGLEVVKTENVIAWMPLPEPYKEDANGEND